MTARAPRASTRQASALGNPIEQLLVSAACAVVLVAAVTMISPLAWPIGAGVFLLWRLATVRAWVLTLAGAVMAAYLGWRDQWAAVLRPVDASWTAGWAAFLEHRPAGLPGVKIAAHLPPGLVPGVWVRPGIALGFILGGMVAWRMERDALEQEWHPWEQRRRKRAASWRRWLAVRASINHAKRSTVLGGLEGPSDLDPRLWRRRRGLFGSGLEPSRTVQSRPIAVVGTTGSGKTTLLERMVAGYAAHGMGFHGLDCKGTDPELGARMLGAYLGQRPDARVRLWPAEPMDAWRGRPGELVSRFLAVEEFSEPYYRAATKRLLQLAFQADPMPASSGQLKARLEQFADELDARAGQGALMRYQTFLASVGELFDGGWSWEDADCSLVTVQSLADREDADAAVRLLVADARHWAALRKPTGQRVGFVIDEFSAVLGAREAVIDLAERARSAGVAAVLSAQSLEGLGNEREALRLVQACSGGVVLMRSPMPDVLAGLAGTVRTPRRTNTVGEDGPTVSGSLSMVEAARIDPNDVRAAEPGECWVIDGGRCGHLRVSKNPRATAHEGYLAAAALVEDLAGNAAEERAFVWLSRLRQTAEELAAASRPRIGRRPQPAALPARPGERPIFALMPPVGDEDPRMVARVLGGLLAVLVRARAGLKRSRRL